MLEDRLMLKFIAETLAALPPASLPSAIQTQIKRRLACITDPLS
jgi:hypothetical protein